MKIIVTGYAGTLGRPLCAALKAAGHAVYGIDLAHDELDWTRRADIGDYRQVRDAIGFYEADPESVVYHLAAEFGRHNGEDYYDTLWRTNAVGTKNVLTVQRERRFRLIFASSSEVYGEGPFDRPLMDEAMTDRLAIRHHNDYAMSKWVCEQQIRNAARAWGTESMCLRFFNAYGPGERYTPYRSVVALFVYRAIRGLPYTVFRGYSRVFQYVDDFIRTLAVAAERFVPGAVANIGGREYRPVADVHAILSEQLGLDPYRPAVAWADRDGHNTVSKRPDIRRAEELFGHDPRTTLSEGIKQTIAWMRGEYGL